MATKAPSIHAYFAACVEHVRERFAEANIGSFCLTIKASGRTMTDRDEVKIEYNLTDSEWGSGVKGNSLEAVIVEQMRRHGWDKSHAPLTLPKPRNNTKQVEQVDEAALDEDY